MSSLFMCISVKKQHLHLAGRCWRGGEKMNFKLKEGPLSSLVRSRRTFFRVIANPESYRGYLLNVL